MSGSLRFVFTERHIERRSLYGHSFLFPGHVVIPKYYYVPADFVEAEQNKHGSQKRFPSNSGRDGKMFLWGQALYNIAKLLGMFESVIESSVCVLQFLKFKYTDGLILCICVHLYWLFCTFLFFLLKCI